MRQATRGRTRLPGAVDPLTQGWTPYSISDCLNWVDVSKLPVSADATPIGGIPNPMTIAGGAWADTYASFPAYKTAIAGRLPSARPDGTNDYFRIPFSPRLSGTSFSICLTFKLLSTAALVVPIRDTAGGDSTGIIGYTTNATTFYRVNGTGSTLSTNIGDEFGTTPHFVVLLKDGTTARAYRDGTERSNWAVNSALSIGAEIYIGRNGAATSYYTFDFFEFMLYDKALSTDEITLLAGYMASKWGLT